MTILGRMPGFQAPPAPARGTHAALAAAAGCAHHIRRGLSIAATAIGGGGVVIGKHICRAALARLRSRRAASPADACSVLAAGALLCVLLLHGLDVRAELLFRSVQQIDGQAQWSEPRNYANPADTL